MPDLVLDDGTTSLPLQLYEDPKTPKRIRTYWDPPSGGPQSLVYRDFKNGFGYSQPGIVTDGYAYATNDNADYGPGLDTRSPGTVVLAGAITEVDTSSLGLTLGYIAQNNSFTDPVSNFWILAGRYALKFTAGVGTPTLGQDIGSGRQFFGAVSAAYGGTPYVWIGDDGGFSKFDGSTWTRTTSFVRTLMATTYWTTTNGLSVQRLVSADTSYTVKHCPMTTDPMTGGNWSAAITPGDGSWAINSLPASGRHVYIGTIGGVFDLDDLGQTVNLAPYQTEQLNEYNNVAAITHDGFVLCGAGVGADAVDVRQPGIKQEEANWVMPGATVGIPNETPIYGRPSAFAKDAGWVPMSVFNGRDSYILYGKRRERLGFPGPGDWVWHGAFAVFRNQLITHMRTRMVNQAGVISRRLWICTAPYTGLSPGRIFYQSLPLTTTARQDAIAGTAHRFGTSATFYPTPGDWGAPGQDKTLVRGVFETRSLDATHTIALSASTDETNYTSLVTTQTSNVDRFPLTGAGITGTQISPKLVFTGTNATPPVLHALDLQASVDPDADEVWEFDVMLVREQEDTNGAFNPHQSPERDYTILASMQSKVITLVGPTKDTYTFLLETALPGNWYQLEKNRDGTRGWARRVTLRGRIVDQPARYGEALFGEADYSA